MKEKAKFSKEEIMKSKKYANRRDALEVVLSNNSSYTLDEVDKNIEKFLKRKVN